MHYYFQYFIQDMTRILYSFWEKETSYFGVGRLWAYVDWQRQQDRYSAITECFKYTCHSLFLLRPGRFFPQSLTPRRLSGADPCKIHPFPEQESLGKEAAAVGDSCHPKGATPSSGEAQFSPFVLNLCVTVLFLQTFPAELSPGSKILLFDLRTNVKWLTQSRHWRRPTMYTHHSGCVCVCVCKRGNKDK